MDFRDVVEKLVEEVWDISLEHFVDKALAEVEELNHEKKSQIMEDQILLRINANSLKAQALEEINVKSFKTESVLADWFVSRIHHLCSLSLLKNPENPLSFKVIHSLPLYAPSDRIVKASKAVKPLHDLKLEDPIIRDYIATGLNVDNVHKIFPVLLELEDVAELQEYVPIIQRNVALKKLNNKNYSAKFNAGTPANIKDILTPNLDVVFVASLNRSKSLGLESNVDTIKKIVSLYDPATSAIVKDVTNSSVHFRFDEPMAFKEDKKMYNLIFFSMRFPIRYQRRALELLAANPLMQSYLFPKNNSLKESESPKTDIELINLEISKNPEQLQAVHYISSGPNAYAPYVIFGPPGTGKTTTIVESILQLRLQHPGSRILVTAGSNSACDTIALRICHYLKSSLRVQEHLSKTDVLPMLRIFSKSILKRKSEEISKDLVKRSNMKWKSGRFAYPAVADIHKYGIVVVTLCTVGKLVTGDVNASNYFTHIFIDEAGASSEPETLVGIMGIKRNMNGNCRVILSGDHKQLGPVLKSDCAIKLGLELSLMERLLDRECYALDDNGNYDRSLQSRLRRNYRSREEIVNLYNCLYYNNELKAMNTENDKFKRNWSFIPDSNYPIVFQAVHGVTTQEESTSFCNKLEIQVLMWYVRRLIEVDGVKENDIGIIAPYKLQCQHIRKRLNDSHWTHVEVGSVENFQGREKDIIIVSMVRSFAALGFLKNPRRLNVLLSRAKSLLLIMGNPVSLRHCKDINFIIEKCKENGTYLYKAKLK